MFHVMPEESQPNFKTVEENVSCTVAHLSALLVREKLGSLDVAGIAGTNASLDLHRHNFVC